MSNKSGRVYLYFLKQSFIHSAPAFIESFSAGIFYGAAAVSRNSVSVKFYCVKLVHPDKMCWSKKISKKMIKGVKTQRGASHYIKRSISEKKKFI